MHVFSTVSKTGTLEIIMLIFLLVLVCTAFGSVFVVFDAVKGLVHSRTSKIQYYPMPLQPALRQIYGMSTSDIAKELRKSGIIVDDGEVKRR